MWNISIWVHIRSFLYRRKFLFRKRNFHKVARLLSPSRCPKVTSRTCTESLICSFRPLFGNAWGLFPHCMCPVDDRSLLYGNIYPLMDHSIRVLLNLCLAPSVCGRVHWYRSIKMTYDEGLLVWCISCVTFFLFLCKTVVGNSLQAV